MVRRGLKDRQIDKNKMEELSLEFDKKGGDISTDPWDYTILVEFGRGVRCSLRGVRELTVMGVVRASDTYRVLGARSPRPGAWRPHPYKLETLCDELSASVDRALESF